MAVMIPPERIIIISEGAARYATEAIAWPDGTVPPTPPTLVSLSLSSTTYPIGTPASGTILGALAGAGITASGLPSGLSIDGPARTWAWTGVGAVATGSMTLVATLAGATNSPLATVIGYAITSPPIWTADPTVSGTPAVGNVATSTDGTITNGSATGRQWLRDGIVISGATGTTYAQTGADAGAMLTLRVSASGSGGAATRTSAPFGPVIGSAPVALWDATDITTLFTDAAGTIPAAVGDPVRHQRDKSGNGFHRVRSDSTLAPILRQRPDGVHYLDYSGGKWIAAQAAAGSWTFLHNGATGATILAAIAWPGNSSGTYMHTASSTTATGILLNRTPDLATRYHVNKGTSGSTALTISIPSVYQSGALRQIVWSMEPGGATTGWIDNAVTPFTGTPTSALPTGNHTSDLQIATTFGGAEYVCAIWDRPLTRAEAARWYNDRLKPIDYPVPATFDYTLIGGGQSNMSGRGSFTAGMVSEAVSPGVYAYTRADEYRIASVPEHGILNQVIATDPNEADIGTPRHGFLLRAAKGIRAASGKNMLLLPCAVGGTSMAQWDTPATANDPATLLGAMVARYNAVRSRGGTPVLLWYGHEASAELAVPNYSAGGVGSAYLTAWQALINRVRSLVVDAPLLFMQLSANHVDPRSTALAAAGEAARQYELLDPRAHMVVTHDLERNAGADAIHVSRAGHDALADRVSLAFRQHILGEAVDGTGPRLLPTLPVTWAGAKVTLTLDKPVNASSGNYSDMLRVYAGGVEQTVSSAVRGANPATVEITCAAALSGPVALTYGYRPTAGGITRTDIILGVTGLPLPVFGPVLAVAA